MVCISAFPPWVCLRWSISDCNFRALSRKDNRGMLGPVLGPEAARTHGSLINHVFGLFTYKHKANGNSFWNEDWKWKGMGSFVSGSFSFFPNLEEKTLSNYAKQLFSASPFFVTPPPPTHTLKNICIVFFGTICSLVKYACPKSFLNIHIYIEREENSVEFQWQDLHFCLFPFRHKRFFLFVCFYMEWAL